MIQKIKVNSCDLRKWDTMNQYPLNVTIDTCIFDSCRYNFGEDGTLGLLEKYVAEGKVRVFISDIVYREMKAHITEKCNQILQEYEGLKRRARKQLSSIFLEQGINALFIEHNGNELKGKCLQLLDEHIQSIAEGVLDIHSVNVGDVFDDYFEMRPPFEEKKTKKSEFPDAFIAHEIKTHFADTKDIVFVISSDKGFIKAFDGLTNYRTMDSLHELFDLINKYDEEKEVEYKRTLTVFDLLKDNISEQVKKYISDNEYIEVFGQSIDRDGIIDGYDYTEISLYSVDNLTVAIHSVDDIKNNCSYITIRCEADMIVDCSYDDYDNAPWDSEEKEYLFVETVTIREVHNARFACSVIIDRENENFVLRPFKVILGGDTRISRKKKSE